VLSPTLCLGVAPVGAILVKKCGSHKLAPALLGPIDALLHVGQLQLLVYRRVSLAQRLVGLLLHVFVVGARHDHTNALGQAGGFHARRPGFAVAVRIRCFGAPFPLGIEAIVVVLFVQLSALDCLEPRPGLLGCHCPIIDVAVTHAHRRKHILGPAKAQLPALGQPRALLLQPAGLYSGSVFRGVEAWGWTTSVRNAAPHLCHRLGAFKHGGALPLAPARPSLAVEDGPAPAHLPLDPRVWA